MNEGQQSATVFPKFCADKWSRCSTLTFNVQLPIHIDKLADVT
jgi:hypothetical protein